VLYIGLRLLIAAGGRMPLGLTRSIGPTLGAAALRMSRRERERTRDHIAIAFPELGPDDRDDLMRRCARHFGTMLAEVAWLSYASEHQVQGLCRLDGFEHFTNALDGGRGVMFATAHCGNWELLSSRLPIAGTPLTTAVRQLDDPRFDRMVTRLRSRFGTEVIPRGPAAGRQLARALGRNRVVGLLIDQDIPSVPGVFVPFFGRPAWTPSGSAMLSLRMRCPLIPGFIHRRRDGTHHAVILPPIEPPDEGSLEDRVRELTAAATAAIEHQVRAHPEQWVWMHRRWRTQPEDVS
jgi:KDO2-lipid IV(A) lauroyltransferase